ncbi:MAG: LysR family transcriptional regulator [Lachnospiraceae bacterium]|nr:LysR family transcriptional regulator [Lachnospiraceae bacterium]
MELLQLRYFKAVAESGTLTQTANQLYISPSSLSATIARLEKELGAHLFDCKGNRLHLNSRGSLFLIPASGFSFCSLLFLDIKKPQPLDFSKDCGAYFYYLALI